MISGYSLIVSGCAHFHSGNLPMISDHMVITPTLVFHHHKTLGAICHIYSGWPMASLPCQLMLWTCMSALESLTKAASALDEREQQEEHLRKCAKKVHESLSLVWPKSKDELSIPDDVHAPILANEYYLCSMPTTHCDGHFNANILFLVESPAFTPLPSLGQPYTITCINDAVLCNTMHTLLVQHHVGHINLVHCPTYGELPFIQLDSAQMISKVKEHSIDTGTPQFWKTMLVLSGYFDCYANREEKDDPLQNVSLFRDSFEFLIGKRNEKSIEARAGQIIQRIQVLENVKTRSHSCQHLFGPYIQWDWKHSDAD